MQITRVNASDAGALKSSGVADVLYHEDESRNWLSMSNGMSAINIGTKGEHESIRDVIYRVRKTIRFALEQKVSSLILSYENFLPFVTYFGDKEDMVRAICSNLVQAAYDFRRYKKAPEDGFPEIKEVFFEGLPEQLLNCVHEGTVIGSCTNTARDLSNTPGNDMGPNKVVDSLNLLRTCKTVTVEVFDDQEVLEMGMGALYSVGQGSKDGSRLAVINYNGASSEDAPIVIVGKTITFDTGGLSLKISGKMLGMHHDMGGGAAVIGIMQAIAGLKLNMNVVGILAIAENAVSEKSTRPGDVVTTYSGKTVEIGNTDAEGRLVLADAISYAVEQFKPEYLIDIATLTGACCVALGGEYMGVFSCSDTHRELFEEFGDLSGDFAWGLPADLIYVAHMKSSVADIGNLSKHSPNAGASSAAAFLMEFSADVPHVHLDIAPRMERTEYEHLAPGATGAGVPLIVSLLLNRAG